jgi:photosystem II stability/assembly factor-like uncharacterized protein
VGQPMAISFVDASRGWLAGRFRMSGWTPQVRITHTVNGGQTWTAVDLDASSNGLDMALCHLGDSAAWCVGPEGFMARTQDGVLWQRMGVPPGWKPLPSRYLRSVVFAGPTYGWVTGVHGTVWQTTDGTSWQPLSVPLLDYWSVQFVSSDRQTIYVLGFDSKIQRFVVQKTTDGGATWRRVRTNLHRQVAHDIFFLDGVHGWMCGNQREHPYLLQTTDGGLSWKTITPSIVSGHFTDLVRVVFTDATHGWAAGQRWVTNSSGEFRSEGLFRTADGGRTWTEVTDTRGRRIAAGFVIFKGTRCGWASGRGGVWRTIDGGVTWRLSLDWPKSQGLTGPLAFSDAKHGWVFTRGQGKQRDAYRDKLFYTADGGKTWTRIPVPVDVVDLASPAVGVAYVIAGDGLILKVTAPGGAVPASGVEGQVLSNGGPAPGEWPLPNVKVEVHEGSLSAPVVALVRADAKGRFRVASPCPLAATR